MPEDLARAIDTQHGELQRQRVLLVAQQDERVALDAALEAAVQRYRELTAPPAPDAAASSEG